MSVTFRSASQDARTTTTNCTAAHPTGAVAGDLLLAFAWSDKDGTLAAMTAPDGTWTLQGSTSSATVGFAKVWSKTDSGSEASTYTFPDSTSADACLGIVAVATGTFDPTTPFAVAPTFGGSTTATASHDAPSVTGVTDGLLVTAHFGGSGTNATRSYAPPSGMTERVDAAPNGWVVLEVNTLTLVADGATGTKTATCSASIPYVSVSLVVAPPSGPITKTGADTSSGANSASVAAVSSITDPGTGSDSGVIGLAFAGSDTASGSESGLISIPVTGNEPGSGDDSAATVAAASTGTDTAVTTETAAAAAEADVVDTAVGADTGAILIRALDTAAGAESQTSTAQVADIDHGAGADGGFFDTAFGDLVMSMWAVDHVTGSLAPLPDYQQLTLSPVRNAPGAISVQYPATGINYGLLHNNVTADCDVEVELWLSGSAGTRLRGYLQDTSIDDADEDKVAAFAGSFLEIRMAEALVFPQVAPLGNDKKELVFSAATAGTIMSTLITQAHTRGSLTDITVDFTGSADSHGVAWPNVVTTKFSPMTTYQSVLDALVNLGLCEWWITADHVMHMVAAGGRGVDRTTGPKPVTLRRGRNITAAPRKHSVRQSSTAVLAAGSEGIYQSAVDAGALSRRGRRVESSASAANLTDVGSVLAFAQTQLQAVSPGLMEITHGIGFNPGEPRPGTVYDVGDFVFSDTDGTLDRRRVVQWTLTVGGSGDANPTGVVTLNDTTTDADQALRRRLNAMSNGSAVVGTSTPGQDTGTPNPPTSLTASSTAYLDGGQVKASVVVGWTAPATNTDGTAYNDPGSTVIQYAFNSSPSIWVDGTRAPGSATSASFSTQPGVAIQIRAAAIDSSGNQSAWSTSLPHTTAADATPPSVPSTPVVTNYLGVLKIAWDGKTSTGADMLSAAPDFDHVDIHISTSSGFTPSSATYFDRLFAAGTQVYTDGTYGVTYFAKFVAIDTTDNASTASGGGSDTPSQVVSADLFANCVGTAQIADAANKTAKIDLLQVNDAQMGSVSVGKVTAGILTAAVTLSGIIRTATTGARSEMDAAGIRLFNTAGTNTVNLKTSDGSALITGQYQTSLTGQRMVINPGGTLADTIQVFPTGGGDFGRIMARTAPSDGSAAILIDGGAANGTARGRFGAYKSEAFISYVTSDTGGDSSSGFSQTALSCSPADILMWTQATIAFDKYSGSSIIPQAHMYMKWVSGGGGSNMPILTANHSSVNAGIKFDSGAVIATINEGSVAGVLRANGFDSSSSAEVKSSITPVMDVFTPLQVIDAAQSYCWKRNDFLGTGGPMDRRRFGPLAEDLHPYLVHQSPRLDGQGMEMAISLDDQIGVLWAGMNQLMARRITSTTATCSIPAGVSLSAGASREVACTWDSSPLAPPEDALVFVNAGLLGNGRVTAWIKTGSVTATGCTVVFKNTSTSPLMVTLVSGLTSVTATVVGMALYTPPLTS